MTLTRRHICLIALGGFILCVSLRLIHYNQSLWCDEMGLALDLIHTHLRDIVAAGPGGYTPNNHVLHTLIVKAILSLHFTRYPARWIRLPSLLAGSLVPLALAWPLRRVAPGVALLTLLLAALNPWLLAYSDEARGYALMTLLGIIATYLLPDSQTRRPVAYLFVVALMLYTVPVAGMLLIGHGIAMFFHRRKLISVWLRQAIAGVVLSVILFLPLSKGIWFYIQHPQPAPDSFVDFANQLPRFAMAGEYLPIRSDPLSEPLLWLLPVLILSLGSLCAWRQSALRFAVTVMASTTLTFVVTALIISGAGQIRFVPWCAIWIVLALSAIVVELQKRRGSIPALILLLIIGGGFAYQDLMLLPSQPIREAVQMADAIVPQGCNISVGFLAANESVALYGSLAKHHRITATPGPGAFLAAEQLGLATTGHTPWLIISYESMVHSTAPQFWDYIQANYQVKQRLTGRITSVAIYAPRHP